MRRVSCQVFITVDVLKLADGCVCVEREECERRVGEEKVWGGLFALLGEFVGLLWFAQLQAIFNHPFCCFHGSCTHPRETIHC